MSRQRILGLVGLACLTAALAGCNKSKPTETPNPQPGPNTPPGQLQPADPYEIDPAKHVIPDKPASGRLGGKPFTPDRVELEGDRLTLRAGKDFFADQQIAISLGNTLKKGDGLKLVVRPAQKWTDGIPTLIVSSSQKEGLPDTKFVNEDYALTLELGKPEKGKIAGKVYLCLPDTGRSYLAGTFVAQRKRSLSEPPGEDEVPFITGAVSPPAENDKWVNVGYVGRTADGKVISDMAGTKASADGGGGIRSESHKPRTAGLRLDKLNPHFDYTNLPPGRYLIFAKYETGPAAWAWVDVPAGGKVSADLKLDPTKQGTVEVKLPAGAREARLIPTDLGTPPPDEAFLHQFGFSLNLTTKANDGKATATVPAGKYRVIAGDLRGEVEVAAGKTVTVEPKPTKE